MKRSEKLKKLGMPKTSMADAAAEEDLELEMMDLDGEEPESPEAEEDMMLEDPEAETAPGLMEDFSDDELLEELKARGLIDADEAEEEVEDEEEDINEPEMGPGDI